MANLLVTDLEGNEHTLEGKDGWSVMEIIRDSNVHINAICGGSCSCSTCHVHVDSAWLSKLEEKSEDEAATLELAEDLSDASRLGCQIKFSDALDGLKVKMTSDSAE